MLVDKVEVGQVICIVSPEMRGDGLSGQNAVLVDDEIQQQVEFFSGGVQPGGIDLYLKSVGIEGDLVELDDMGAAEIFAAVDCPDAGVELGQVEGFCDVVVGAVLQANDLIVQGILCGNDEDVAVFVFGADQVEELQAVAVRKADVEEDTVILEKAQLFAGQLHGAGKFAYVTFAGEKIVDIAGQLLVVFDDQYLHGVKVRTRWPMSLFTFYPAVSVDDEDLGGIAILVYRKDDREVIFFGKEFRGR